MENPGHLTCGFPQSGFWNWHSLGAAQHVPPFTVFPANWQLSPETWSDLSSVFLARLLAVMCSGGIGCLALSLSWHHTCYCMMLTSDNSLWLAKCWYSIELILFIYITRNTFRKRYFASSSIWVPGSSCRKGRINTAFFLFINFWDTKLVLYHPPKGYHLVSLLLLKLL